MTKQDQIIIVIDDARTRARYRRNKLLMMRDEVVCRFILPGGAPFNQNDLGGEPYFRSELTGGGGEKERVKRTIVEIVTEETTPGGTVHQTAMRGARMIERALQLTPGGRNLSYIEHCEDCKKKGSSCSACVKVNGQHKSNARNKNKRELFPQTQESHLAKRRETHADTVPQ